MTTGSGPPRHRRPGKHAGSDKEARQVAECTLEPATEGADGRKSFRQHPGEAISPGTGQPQP